MAESQRFTEKIVNDVDVCEDSGFSSITHKSSSSNGEGSNEDKIQVVDTKLIEEEYSKLEKIREKKELLNEAKLKKRLEQEAYEKEIQEQQYKRLMHLLNRSKALSTFMFQKIDVGKISTLKRKRVLKNDELLNKNTEITNNFIKEPDIKKKKKFNLSDEDIAEELETLSNEDYNNKENSEPYESSEDSADTNQFINPKYFDGELRDYQKVGVNWLKVLYENGINGILADEMGLGKTVQVVALLSYLIEKQVPGPYMIVVPLSTLPNWQSEFERFAPKLPVVVYYGNKNERLSLRSKISRKTHIGNKIYTYPVVLLTFQTPLADENFLRKFHWRYIVVDEAQRIKNYKTQLFRILQSYKSVNRLLLTGTPLQNNLSELWSLLNFLLPDIFNNLQVFESWFDAKQVQDEAGKKKFLQQEQEKHIISSLRQILKPFMLRRLKEEVCPDIPPIKEVIVHTPLTRFQYEIYSAVINRNIDRYLHVDRKSLVVDVEGVRPKRKCTQKVDLDDIDNISFASDLSETDSDEINRWRQYLEVTEENYYFLLKLKLVNIAMAYRHITNHPFILHNPLDTGLSKVGMEDILKVSGKLMVLDLMLKKLKKNGHKILLFSNFVKVLNVLEDYLQTQNYLYVRLDGSIKYEDRKYGIDEFQNNPEVFLFLLTTKAGAVGLNLAAADTVIIYDSDWNPQNDLQAMARCHRIGQTKPVVAYRLCTKGTIDEEIIKRASTKRFLEKAVISNKGKEFETKDGQIYLKTLLEDNSSAVIDPKKGVYSDAEIEDILDRSDMVVTIKSDNK